MRSIRLSLLVYSVVLLLVGLGGVSLLSYRVAAATLVDKEKATLSRIASELDAKIKNVHVERDAQLLKRARALAAKQSRPPRLDWFNSLGVLGVAAVPNGYLNAGVHMRLGSPPWSWRFTPWQLRLLEARTLDQIVHGDEGPSDDEDDAPAEFCQTYLRNGQPWERTSNLGANVFSLPPDFDRRGGNANPVERFEDVSVGDVAVRRVTLKHHRLFTAPPPLANVAPIGGGKTFGRFGNPMGAALHMKGYSDPHYYVQFAFASAPFERQIDALHGEYARRREDVREETAAALQTLRQKMFVWNGLTLAAVLVGGLTLVSFGLAPLRRLSDAVSQVSERDFQLKVEPGTLPSELAPVAVRLQETLGQLRKAFSREKQAAQDISHDLRTPLAALTTTLDVALKRPRTPAEYREILEECRLSAGEMNHLVERLLALARVDAGTATVQARDVDLVSIAQTAADLVRPLARVRDVTVSTALPPSLVARTDPDKFRDVLANLLHNAVDYNRPGGRIDLTLTHTGDAVEIAVADTGVGIAPEARGRLFERFFRADPSRHSDTPHCGLGLAIVKSYVDLMRGAVDVTSEVGVGTTFRIRLPYVAPPTAIRETSGQGGSA